MTQSLKVCPFWSFGPNSRSCSVFVAVSVFMASTLVSGTLVQWVQQIFLASRQALTPTAVCSVFPVSSALLAFLWCISILINMVTEGRAGGSVCCWIRLSDVNIWHVKVSVCAERMTSEGDERGNSDSVLVQMEHLIFLASDYIHLNSLYYHFHKRSDLQTCKHILS